MVKKLTATKIRVYYIYILFSKIFVAVIFHLILGKEFRKNLCNPVAALMKNALHVDCIWVKMWSHVTSHEKNKNIFHICCDLTWDHVKSFFRVSIELAERQTCSLQKSFAYPSSCGELPLFVREKNLVQTLSFLIVQREGSFIRIVVVLWWL